MKWLRLTQQSGKAIWINMALVRVMGRNNSTGMTWLECEAEFVYDVQEPPEAILAMLEVPQK